MCCISVESPTKVSGVEKSGEFQPKSSSHLREEGLESLMKAGNNVEEREATISRGNGYSFLFYINESTSAHKTDTQMYCKPGFIGLSPTEGFSRSVGRHNDLQVEIKCNLDVNV